jgi:hypothetical protein
MLHVLKLGAEKGSGYMDKNVVRQMVCVLSVLGTIGGNALANILPFNGQSTGAVSNKFDVLFTPAGYVFGIWGLLYLTWIVFAAFQFLPSQKQNPRLAHVTYLFSVSGLINVLWLLLWHYEYFALTVLAMLVLLGLLIACYLRLDIGRARVSFIERCCVDVPFSLYLAWISVATIANVTIFLRHVGWSGWGLPESVWASVMIAVATGLGVIACAQRRDLAFVAVLAWAFVGIADKQAATPTVVTAAWLATGVLGLATLGRLVYDVRRRQGAAI